jgi:glycine/D-amino acid oxidase-like deaminating enzyme
MKVIEKLIHGFGDRLILEANTLVTEVKYDPAADQMRPYKVSTIRGDIRARRVIHCTNGYAGRLLPGLRGRLFPYRGTMTVQDLGGNLPNRGADNSWNLYHPPRYDTESSMVLDGEYYFQQNPSLGYYFFGGGAQTAQSTFNSDDSKIESASVQNMQSVLHKYFGKDFITADERSDLVAAWSGIMGFTGDGFPLVGRLPGSVSQYPNDGSNEWVAAGFNGMGMCHSWRAGEAVVKMALDQDVSDWLPDSFRLSTERLHGPLTIEASVEAMKFFLLQNEGAEVNG